MAMAVINLASFTHVSPCKPGQQLVMSRHVTNVGLFGRRKWRRKVKPTLKEMPTKLKKMLMTVPIPTARPQLTSPHTPTHLFPSNNVA